VETAGDLDKCHNRADVQWRIQKTSMYNSLKRFCSVEQRTRIVAGRGCGIREMEGWMECT
jgi:hypothetical protein